MAKDKTPYTNEIGWLVLLLALILIGLTYMASMWLFSSTSNNTKINPGYDNIYNPSETPPRIITPPPITPSPSTVRSTFSHFS